MTASNSTARRRCYSCGAKNPGDAESCGSCGVAFLALCECGASHSVYAIRCDACGAEKLPRRFPFLRRRVFRLGLASLVLVAGGGLATVALRRPPPSAWELQTEFSLLAQADQLESALEVAQRLTRAHPTNVEGWLQYAWILKRLGRDSNEWVPALERTLELDPRESRALLMLGTLRADQGEREQAIELLERASRAASPPPAVFRKLAQLELQAARPDPRRVLDHIHEARSRGAVDGMMEVREAELFLELYAGTPHESLPIEIRDAIRRAKVFLAELDARADDRPVALYLLRARVSLALGDPDDALSLTSAGLREMDADDSVSEARLRTIAGQALLMRGPSYVDEAREEFASALAKRPDSRTASEIVRFLAARGRRDLAESILRDAVREGDPNGALRLRLAAEFTQVGEPERALELVDDVATVFAESTELDMVRGDARALLGQDEAAAEAYRRARERSPALLEPRLRLVFLEHRDAEGRTREERRDTALAQLDELDETFAGEARLQLARASILRVGLKPIEARDILRKLVERRPSMTNAWYELGLSERAVGSIESVRAAALAFGEARRLEPADEEIAALEIETHLLAGDAGAAIVAATEALAARGDSARLLRLRARAHTANGRPGHASADLRKLLTVSPRDAEATVRLIEAEYKADRPSAAREIALRAGEWLPADARERIDLLHTIHSDGIDASLARLAEAGPSQLLLKLQLHLGRVDAAAKTARALLAERPGAPGPTFSLLAALLDGGAPDESRLTEARAAVAAVSPDAPREMMDLLEGRLALADGDAARALPLLARAATTFPLAPVVVSYHAEALWQTGDPAESLGQFRRAIAVPGAPPGLATTLAARLREVAMQSDDPAVIAPLAREALDHVADDWRAMELLAQAELSRGNSAAGLTWLERAIAVGTAGENDFLRLHERRLGALLSAGAPGKLVAVFPTLPAAVQSSYIGRLTKGFASLQTGSPADARDAFESCRGERDDDPLVRFGLACLAVGEGRMEDAGRVAAEWRSAPAFEPAVDLGPSLIRVILQHGAVGAALEELRRYVVAGTGTSLDSPDWRRNWRNEEIALLQQLGRTDEALDLQRTALDAATDATRDDERLSLAAVLATRPEDANAALTELRRVSEEARGRPSAVATEALCYLHLRNHPRAEQLAREVVGSTGEAEISPSTLAAARFVLGSTAAAREDWEAAAEHFRVQAALTPGSATAANNAAWCYAMTASELETASELAAHAVALTPDDPNVWDTLGVVCVLTRRNADARAAFERGLALREQAGAPDDTAWAKTALRLSRLLWTAGEPEASASLRRRALDVGTPAVQALDTELNGQD